ncbi:MAG: T9SS type A sorting domain-containing protein [Deferribacteres bacterium]|nr:T9SS type A sorting domain-containing protein [Deferribacteres bacterium]
MNASDIAQLYNTSYDYSIVIDQKGIIQYSDWGANTEAVKNVIDNLLANSTVVKNQAINSTSFALVGNYPNPFNPATVIEFTLEKSQRTSLKIYDPLGRLVKILANGVLDSGTHKKQWRALDEAGQPVSSGVYYAVLQGEDQRRTRKLLLVK